MDEKYIGFLQVLETAPDTFLGAILVTTMTSVPVEFRVTLPVKPTSIQKSLYGDSMVSYIGTELCGKQLLEAITHTIELAFVAPDYMLGTRAASAAPIVYLESAGDALDTSKIDEIKSEADDTVLQKTWQFNTKFQPLMIKSAPKFPKDVDDTQVIIEELALTFDLLEPFNRINRAIEVLAHQDKRFAFENG